MLLTRALAAACCLVLACDCEEEPSAPLDSSVPRADAGRDSAPPLRDAEQDSPADAAPDPDDPIWRPVEGFHDGCIIERAERPDVLFTGAWKDCPDAPACRRLVSHTVVEAVGTIHAGMGFIVVVQGDPQIEGARVTVLSPVEGPAILAYRERRYPSGVCQVGPYGLGGGSFGVIGFSGYGSWPNQEIVFHGSLDDGLPNPWPAS
jgi:hypothetical protein